MGKREAARSTTLCVTCVGICCHALCAILPLPDPSRTLAFPPSLCSASNGAPNTSSSGCPPSCSGRQGGKDGRALTSTAALQSRRRSQMAPAAGSAPAATGRPAHGAASALSATTQGGGSSRRRSLSYMRGAWLGLQHARRQRWGAGRLEQRQSSVILEAVLMPHQPPSYFTVHPSALLPSVQPASTPPTWPRRAARLRARPGRHPPAAAPAGRARGSPALPPHRRARPAPARRPLTAPWERSRPREPAAGN